VALIVLDTDVVSLYRAGRLTADFARRVATNGPQHRLSDRWRAVEVGPDEALGRRPPRRSGALALFLDQALILPAGRKVATVWG
jgi:hypothetical protein